MEDQAKLPYTNAVIHEIQRCADIIPITIPLITYHDTEVDKFVIPKVQSFQIMLLGNKSCQIIHDGVNYSIGCQ